MLVCTKVIIESPGLLTTVQDNGRPHLQHLGIPACGAMDPLSWQIANLLVGNKNNEAGLECTLSGPVLTFSSSTLVALAGAQVDAKLNGYDVPMYMTIAIQAGDTLDLTRMVQGMRLYVAFAGGIDVPEILGSRSTYLPLQLGSQDRRLKMGDQLQLFTPDDNQLFDRGISLEHPLIPHFEKDLVTTIHMVAGPQQAYFNAAMIQFLTEGDYALDIKSDRMGLRFNGPKISANSEKSMISDGIPWGAMQITRGGQPIIMMADRQPTGGYPKIAKIIQTDLPKLAQLRPQAKVNFQWVTQEEALTRYRKQHQYLEELMQRCADVPKQTRLYRIYGEGACYQVSVTPLEEDKN